MQIGKSRFACRASNVEVATVQPIVPAIVPAPVTVSQRIGRTASEPVDSAIRSTASATATEVSATPNSSDLRVRPSAAPRATATTSEISPRPM